MSFKRKWPEGLEDAVASAALDENRDAPTVCRMLHAGELAGWDAWPVPLGTVRIWIGNARRDLRVRETAAQRPADVLDVVLSQLVHGVKRDGDRYARRVSKGQTKPGEASALARDVESVAKALKSAQDPPAKPTAEQRRAGAARERPTADFLESLAADQQRNGA